jgi:putative flippase GtrA
VSPAGRPEGEHRSPRGEGSSIGQFVRIVAVGIFNTLLGYAVIFACMYIARMIAEASNVAGYAVGLVASYLLNRSFTFGSRARVSGELLRFLAVFGIAYALNFVALLVLIHRLDVHAGLSQVLAGVVYVAASYLMNKFYVFKPSRAA